MIINNKIFTIILGLSKLVLYLCWSQTLLIKIFIMSKKVAKIVTYSLSTRVVVDELCTNEQIVNSTYKNILAKVQNGELNENLESIKDDTECPVGTFETDVPYVTRVILSTVDKKYSIEGIGIPPQIISFDNYSDWDTIKGLDGDDVLDCQIDIDVDVDESTIYQFQTVDLTIDEEGRTTIGGHYEGIDVIVSDKPLTQAIAETVFKYS